MRSGVQAQIVDMLVSSDNQETWNRSVGSLVSAICRRSDTSSIKTVATSRYMAGALGANGFWRGVGLPIYSNKQLEMDKIHLAMSDGDLLTLYLEELESAAR
jgi:hypothetical protein